MFRELGLGRIIEFGESAEPVPLPGTDSMRRFMHPGGCRHGRRRPGRS